MELEVVRYAYLPAATLGLLEVGTETFEILERPWIPNPAGPGGMPRESCVPDGLYALRPWDSPKHGACYLLSSAVAGVYPTELPAGQAFGRSLILIHPANQVSELLGCLAPGTRAGLADGKNWVYESRRAFTRISELLGRTDVHQLRVRPTAGTEEPE